jgi:xanthine dehydrogenase accessory factor
MATSAWREPLEATPRRGPSGAAAADVFGFLKDGLAAGRRGVLATLTGVEGSSARAPGTHMAVREDGLYCGSFSGGCVEAGIAAEALEALRDGRPRTVRFGRGSPYLDLRLPCGGGIDLLFQPDPPLAAVAEIVRRLQGREAVGLVLGGAELGIEAYAGAKSHWSERGFHVHHRPPLRLIIAGDSAEALALAGLARLYGAETLLLSPDRALLADSPPGAACSRLLSPSALPVLARDPWSAVALLFHDHDWDAPLLERALDSGAFWIGAMGSARTHEERLDRLAARGVPAPARARVRGPIGLLPSCRDPSTLALSALAEIVAAFAATP